MEIKNKIPQSPEAESSVLGSILIEPKKFLSVRGFIEAEDFYNKNNLEIFQAMVEIHESEGALDLVTVAQKLSDKKLLKQIGGRSYLAGLTEQVPTASHAEEYAKIIKGKSLARKVIKGGSEVFKSGMSENLAEAEEKMLDTLHRMNENNSNEDRSIVEILEEIEKSEATGGVRGVDTGIKCLDETTKGLRSGHFWIIGGEYKSGKTNCALEIVRRVARKHRVLFYSLEMNSDEVVSILIREEQRKKDRNAAKKAVASLDKNLMIYDNKFRLAQLEAHILSQEIKPVVVFIDHIGLVETDDKETTPRLERVSRTLKLLAKRAGTCIVSLSQISEENIRRKAGSFKGSGNIAADCDVGMVLVKDNESELDEVKFVIDVRFNRHGRRKKIDLYFDNSRGLIMFDDDVAEQQAANLALPAEEKIEDFVDLPTF